MKRNALTLSLSLICAGAVIAAVPIALGGCDSRTTKSKTTTTRTTETPDASKKTTETTERKETVDPKK